PGASKMPEGVKLGGSWTRNDNAYAPGTFTRSVEIDGQRYTASHAESGYMSVRGADGRDLGTMRQDDWAEAAKRARSPRPAEMTDEEARAAQDAIRARL